MKLILATQNAHKAKEFSRLLAPYGVNVIPMTAAGVFELPPEDGTTFAENAAIKARAVFAATGGAVLADDSGLTVDALSGAPGVYSARYAGEGASSEDCIRKLLLELRDIPKNKRTARFVCALVLIEPDGSEHLFEESSNEGTIAFSPRGDSGFGYDPVFLVGDHSFAELTPEEKDRVSHRGKALRRLAAWFREKGEGI